MRTIGKSLALASVFSLGSAESLQAGCCCCRVPPTPQQIAAQKAWERNKQIGICSALGSVVLCGLYLLAREGRQVISLPPSYE